MTPPASVADALAFSALPVETQELARRALHDEIEDEIRADEGEYYNTVGDEAREEMQGAFTAKWTALRSDLTDRLAQIESEMMAIRKVLSEFEPW